MANSIGNGNSGGRAGQIGRTFQNDVAAWLAAAMLAEKSLDVFKLPKKCRVSGLVCETRAGVDDIHAELSSGGVLKLECKTRLDVSGKQPEFAGTVAKMVWELHRNAQFNPSKDRLAIVVPMEGSQSLNSLQRAWELVAAGGTERLNREPDHVQSAFATFSTAAIAYASSEGIGVVDLQTLAKISRIVRLNRLPGGIVTEAQGWLREVYPAGDHAALAYGHIRASIEVMAGTGTFMSRQNLLDHLREEEVIDRRSPNYQEDIDRLLAHSVRERDALLHSEQLRHRTVAESPGVTAILDAAREGSLLITGPPHSGKAAVLLTLCDIWERELSGPVVLLRADQHRAIATLPDLDQALGIDHDLTEILENWPGDARGLVAIDALGTLPGAGAEAQFALLVRKVEELSARWSVVATTDAVSFLKSDNLHLHFRGGPVEGAPQDAQLAQHRHIAVAFDARTPARRPTDRAIWTTLISIALIVALIGGLISLVRPGAQRTASEATTTQAAIPAEGAAPASPRRNPSSPPSPVPDGSQEATPVIKIIDSDSQSRRRVAGDIAAEIRSQNGYIARGEPLQSDWLVQAEQLGSSRPAVLVAHLHAFKRPPADPDNPTTDAFMRERAAEDELFRGLLRFKNGAVDQQTGRPSFIPIILYSSSFMEKSEEQSCRDVLAIAKRLKKDSDEDDQAYRMITTNITLMPLPNDATTRKGGLSGLVKLVHDRVVLPRPSGMATAPKHVGHGKAAFDCRAMASAAQ